MRWFPAVMMMMALDVESQFGDTKKNFTFSGTSGDMTLPSTVVVSSWDPDDPSITRFANFSIDEEGLNSYEATTVGNHEIDQAEPTNNVAYILFEKDVADDAVLECEIDTSTNGIEKIIVDECRLLQPLGISMETVITNSNTGEPLTDPTGADGSAPSSDENGKPGKNNGTTKNVGIVALLFSIILQLMYL